MNNDNYAPKPTSKSTCKTCSMCGVSKPLAEFPPILRRSGHKSECRPCTRQRSKDFYWRDPERARSEARRYRQNRINAQKPARKSSSVFCRICTKRITAQPNRGPRPFTCCRKCDVENDRRVRLNNRYWRKIDRLEEEIVCGGCGERFVRRTDHQRYCDDDCRRIADLRRRRERRAAKRRQGAH